MADVNELLRAEFNQWALEGRGEEMQRNHLHLARQAMAQMALQPGERVLDLGCGAGWATRLLAEAVAGGQGMAAGLDISQEMIARARAASRELENLLFVVGAADEIPWKDEYFDKILSIESFYYYPEQEAVLRELYRVLLPGGLLLILINLYKENPHSLGWVSRLNVPVHVRSEGEYAQMLRAHGFTDITVAHIPGLTETSNPDNGGSGQAKNGFANTWFTDEAQWREFQRIGALLLVARRT